MTIGMCYRMMNGGVVVLFEKVWLWIFRDSPHKNGSAVHTPAESLMSSSSGHRFLDFLQGGVQTKHKLLQIGLFKGRGHCCFCGGHDFIEFEAEPFICCRKPWRTMQMWLEAFRRPLSKAETTTPSTTTTSSVLPNSTTISAAIATKRSMPCVSD
jgi:hypothetical protein